MSELTDNELMLLVKSGDLDKMSMLFKRHSRSLYRFLFHMTYNKEASEDMVQTVFYRMLKYRHTFTARGEFVVWMFHLGRNVLKDTSKQQHRKGKNEDLESIAEKTGSGILADDQLRKKQDELLLYQALNKLSGDEREILVLNKLQELKYHEIAQLLNITEGAVKVRVHRAFNQLKSFYQQNNLL